MIWRKPEKCPKGLSQNAFAALTPTFVVREIYYYIIIPGFRTEQVSLITTLLDTKIYPTLEFVRLYDFRWDVEVDLKHLLTTLGMDVLRCKTPLTVLKQNSSPNKAQTQFISGKYICVVIEPLNKTERHCCPKRL